MLVIHDHVTNEAFDRLGTTCIGLGLVRLLQDAKRFEEARKVLYALENGAESSKPSQKRSGITQRPLRLSRSKKIDAA
jgi:hypothetical protein